MPSASTALLQPPLPAPSSASWGVGKYLLVIVVAAIPTAMALGLGFAAGNPYVGAIIGAVPFGLLILWKPEIGLYVLALYVPFEVYGTIGGTVRPTKVLGLYTALALLAHLVGRRRIEARVPALWMALGFVAWATLSITVARTPDAAWSGALTLLQMWGLLFVAINACLTKEQAEAFLWTVFLGAVLAGIFAFFMTPPVQHVYDVRRITVGAQDANSFAKDLLAGVFLAPFLASRCRGWLAMLVWLLGLGTLMAIVLTGSRTGYAAVYVGIVVFILSYRPIMLSKRVVLVIVVTIVLGLLVMLGSITGVISAGLWQRVATLWQRGLHEGNRMWFWEHAFQMGARHPLLGVGIANFQFEMLQYGFHKVTHNDFLSHFAEVGLPGLMFYCAFLVATLKRAASALSPSLRSGLIGLLAAAVIGSMANPSSYQKGFWLQMAACLLGGTVLAVASTLAGARQPHAPTSDLRQSG